MQNRSLLQAARSCNSIKDSDLISAGSCVEALALDSLARLLFSAKERRLLRKLYSAYETHLENRFAESLFSAEEKPRLESYLLWDRFCRLTDAEARGTAMSDAESVAFIGSGPFPISALQYARLRAVSVCCFDTNESAVKTSREIIAALGLSHAIRTECIAGENADFSRFDVITVAVLATPKREILRRIADTARTGTRVAFRTSIANCEVIYERFRGSLPAGLAQYALHHAGFDDTISCRFLKRT